MSLFSSLYSGASGLAANSLELAVVGDNIANSNTVGYKSHRAAFEDALAQSLVGISGQRGMGTQLAAVQRMMTQGALIGTGSPTDLAIQGEGFFVVRGSANGREGIFFSRAGQFTLDRDGYLTTSDGMRVQGYAANELGELQRTLGDIRIAGLTSTPRATETITIRANLQADAAVPAAFDPANPDATSSFSTSTTVYDSLGKPHQVEIYFCKVADGSWEWHALVDGGSIDGGTPGVSEEIASGTLTFDTGGKLVSQTQTSDFRPVGATGPQPLTFDFGDPTSTGGTGLAGITQFASPSAVTFLNQDGYAAGNFASVSIEADGSIVGSFTNGQTRVIGQVALADFTAPDKLERLGGNLYAANQLTGEPNIGVATTGGRGSIVSGALEQSNVDLANEFIRMISAQRNFQANSKTLTTADQLLADLIQLKR